MSMIEVNLVKPVTLLRNGVEIIIPEDTQVQYDAVNGYAVWNDESFELFRDEYCMTH